MDASIQVTFYSRDPSLVIPEAPLLIPSSMKRSGLLDIIHQLIDSNLLFDFIIDGEMIKNSLGSFMDTRNLSAENKQRIEVVKSVKPPSGKNQVPQDDWISCISMRNGLILVGSFDGAVTLYDSEGSKVARSVFESPVKCCDWLADDIVMIGYQSSELIAYKIVKDIFEVLFECLGHDSSVESLAISSESIASGSWDGKICVWTRDLNDLQVVQSGGNEEMIKTPTFILEGHAGSVSCLGFSSDSLYSGSWDHTLRCWDLTSETNTLTMNCEQVVTCLTISQDSGLIVTGHSDSLVRVWDPRSESVKIKFQGHSNWVSSVQWSDSYHILSTSYDGTLKLWDVRSSAPLWSKSFGSKLFALASTPSIIALGGESSSLVLLSQ